MSPKGKEGFPKTARLRKRPEFLQLSRTGKKIHCANFLVLTETHYAGETRLGVTVSGKAGNAVERNHIKRRVREFFRRRRHELPPGMDVLVIARKSAGELSFSQVAKELSRCLIHP